MSYAGHNPEVSMMKSFLEKPIIPDETLDHYALQLSMDSWGVSAHFGHQVLSNRSMVLRMQSPYGDW
jgi:hypothetical protein